MYNKKKTINIIIMFLIIMATSFLSIMVANFFNSEKKDTDYQKLGLGLNKHDIDYYTVYDEDISETYKVYKLNIFESLENIRIKLENNDLWSKEKFYEYMMMKFYEIIGNKEQELDREDLYYYHHDGIYAIYDIKNAKIYYFNKVFQSSQHEFSEILGIDTRNYTDKEVYDVRGGLQFDGRDYYVYKFNDEQGKCIVETLKNDSKWSKEKIEDDKLKALEYSKEVHSIENGYYHYELVCRTRDENKERNVTKENATGYEIGVYDADKNILYYCWESI